jgi:cytochrome d ubiquinol oxidase subunit II
VCDVNLNTLWFVLIAVLFVGYFFLEGFDYGVGLLMPFIGRTDRERRAVVATIGPVWDANEVWLITAGGAMFAAFPQWYATVFSGFYLALALLLTALIVRGVGLEFRSKDASRRWRGLWDALIWFGSLVPPLIWGIAMANLLHGIPINAQMNYVGGFGQLLNPYALAGGLAAVSLFALHGALYLTLKVPEELAERTQRLTYIVGAVATALYFLFIILSYFYTDFTTKVGVDPGVIPILAAFSIVAVRFLLVRKSFGWAFALNGLAIVLSVIMVFMILYPDVLISSLNPRWDLTIYNAASNPYSLRVMTIVAVSALPVVLAYQAWSYWVFRQRVSMKEHFHY